LLDPLKKKTDNEEFYSDFIATIKNKIEESPKDEKFSLIFVVYTELGSRPYQYLVAAVMCEAVDVEIPECRDRSYYVFYRLPSHELAEILLNDMTFERSEFPKFRYGE